METTIVHVLGNSSKFHQEKPYRSTYFIEIVKNVTIFIVRCIQTYIIKKNQPSVNRFVNIFMF